MFLSDSESSIPTMQTSVELSIEAITSGENPGGVSTTTKSCEARNNGYSSRRNSMVTAAAWSGRTGATSTCAPLGCGVR
jgi:hypothetical protein